MGGGAAGGARRFIASAATKARLETVIAQQPQHVFGDPGGGIADKADMASLQIGDAADRVIDRAVGSEEDRVDREIAARRIGGPIGVEGDAGAAAISLDVAAQCRDLEMSRRDQGGYGAM